MKSKDIINDIIESILSGELPKDSKLPSESSLSERYECNRHTIRKVIDFLLERGYLRKLHGGSTYINGTPSDHALSLCSLFDLYSAKDIKTKVINFEKTNPSPIVANKLKINESDKIWHIVRVRYTLGTPQQIEYIHMPFSLFADLTLKNCEASLLSYIEYEMDYEITHGIKTIKATTTNEFEDKIFNCEKQTSILQIENVGYLTNSRIYEYSINKHMNNEMIFYAKR
ncbi:MAG: GntR family transcriptional regulator [Clostridiaceae bacterium]